jgi:hypothetical protein
MSAGQWFPTTAMKASENERHDDDIVELARNRTKSVCLSDLLPAGVDRLGRGFL